MSAAAWLLAALVCADTSERKAPAYTAASIVNSAANVPGLLAPNTFASIYGTDLAFVTRIMTVEDLRAERLPTTLSGSGVRVFVRRIPVSIWYVSPTQVNFLMPPGMEAGPAEVFLTLDGRQGPAVTIELEETGPAFFQIDATTILAVHLDASVVTAESPAVLGGHVTLYATGLGVTSPESQPNELPFVPAPLRDLGLLRVVIDGVDLARERIEYAGVAPGLAGVYQINMRLPDDLGPDPEMRIGFGGRLSPAGLHLPVR